MAYRIIYMDNFKKITEFNIKLNRDTVFHLIDCYPDSPIYEEIVEEFEKLVDKVQQLIKPKAFYKFESASNELATRSEGNIIAKTPVVFVLLTIGDEITDLISDYFARGEYLIGMLVNAMADTYLFQMDDKFKDNINFSCISRHLGIDKRLEAPSNIPMKVQKDILEEIKESEKLTIELTEGFMFTSIKTMGYILVLTDDETAIYSGHNCSACSNKNCKMRKA